jgi:hypothetical protein
MMGRSRSIMTGGEGDTSTAPTEKQSLMTTLGA